MSVEEMDEHKEKTEQLGVKIMDLLADEKTPPVERGTLSLLHQMTTTLAAAADKISDNTRSIDTLTDTVTTHITTEDQTIASAKGAWYILAWVLGIVQTCVGGAAIWLFTEINQLRAMSQVNATDIRLLAQTFKAHEESTKLELQLLKAERNGK